MFSVRVKSAFFVIVMAGSMTAALAYAASAVRVRGGEHDTYSRLVFDWKEPVTYDLDLRKDGLVHLSFNKNASLDTADLHVDTLRHVGAVTSLSSHPLRVAIQMAPGQAISDFKLGHRVVVDVKSQSKPGPVNPPQAKKVAPASAAPKPAAKQPEKASYDHAPSEVKEPAAKVEKVPETAARPPSQDGLKPARTLKRDVAPVASLAPRSQAQSHSLRLSSKRTVPSIDTSARHPNLIMVTSVTPTAMAAFVLNDQLWLVNDQEKMLLRPHIVGEQKDDFGTPEEVKHDDAKIFTVNALGGAQYMAQGGGLAWRILVGHDLRPEKKPVEAVRQGVIPHQGRSGQVFWKMPEVGEVLRVEDPVSKAMMFVVTVSDAHAYGGPALDFIDFKTLESSAGLAIVPKVDDLKVEAVDGGVVVYRTGRVPLAVSEQGMVETALLSQHAKHSDDAHGQGDAEKQKSREPRLFEFENWQLGGVDGLAENKAIVLATLPGLNRDGQVGGLMDLARMYIANGMGAEAAGFLRIVQDVLPDLSSSPEFQALEGVLEAINGHYEASFKALSGDLLKNKDEVRYWRSYALAKLYDWQQAADILPANFDDVHHYPAEVAVPLALTLSEVTLRAGDKQRTKELFGILDGFEHHEFMRGPHQAAYSYLKGELLRQEGKTDKAISAWKKLYEGDDDLYRVRAGLALTRLEQEEKDLPLKKAIDRLERLRYAWRGDDLEAQVNYWLGRTYFDDAQYVKGLNIMRDAASYATGVHLGQRIIEEMSEEFRNLYLGERLYKLSGPDVAALYEHFAELVPSGEVGDLMGRRLADRLVQANLYERAIEILSYQLENKLQGEDAYRVAVKLGVVHQLQGDNEKALDLLAQAKDLKATIPSLAVDPDVNQELTLLTARALSRSDQPKKALDLLMEHDLTPEINLLRADIAWRHAFWDDAAEALQNVLQDEKVLAGNHLTDEQADLILRRAVALNLAGDRIRLANIREKFADTMKKTPRARAFDVVTRMRKNAELADRETLFSVAAEVDMFADFIEDYLQDDEDGADTDAQAE